MKLKTIVVSFCLLFWPVSLFLANTPSNFLHYAIPTAFLICFCLLHKAKNFLYPAPLLAIPFFEPKLTILPAVFFLIIFFIDKTKINLISLIISLLILIPLFPAFKSQTIFHPDHNAYQKVIQDTRLYNNIFEARLFHNKARVYLDKVNDRFFALTDPNNYFAGFHPREIIVDNQNLKKLPLFSIIFLGASLLNLKTLKNKKLILVLLLASVINLSFLTNFDRTDFILYLPFTLLTIYGINILTKKHSLKVSLFLVLFILISSIEYLKIFIDLANR